MAEATPVRRSALWTASTLGQIEEVRQLLAEEVDIEESGGEQKTTPLHQAAGDGHEQIALLLLEHQADVSAEDTSGRTPLTHAAIEGQETVVRLLVQHQADVSARDTGGLTALHGATFMGHETVARLLLEHQADVSAEDTSGRTPLTHSAIHGQETVVRLLVEHQADISARDNQGVTALHQAALMGHETVARLLLDMGADEQSEANEGTTPEGLATVQGHHQLAMMLNAKGVRRAKCVAFAMGHHDRLGAGSPVLELDAGVVRMCSRCSRCSRQAPSRQMSQDLCFCWAPCSIRTRKRGVGGRMVGRLWNPGRRMMGRRGKPRTMSGRKLVSYIGVVRRLILPTVGS